MGRSRMGVEVVEVPLWSGMGPYPIAASFAAGLAAVPVLAAQAQYYPGHFR